MKEGSGFRSPRQQCQKSAAPQRSGAIWFILGLQSPEYTGTLTLEKVRLTLFQRNLQEKELGSGRRKAPRSRTYQ